LKKSTGKAICYSSSFANCGTFFSASFLHVYCEEKGYVLKRTGVTKLPLKKAAIIMIDCDLYESTVSVLDFITDYLQD
jgi:hypothetical protein